MGLSARDPIRSPRNSDEAVGDDARSPRIQGLLAPMPFHFPQRWIRFLLHPSRPHVRNEALLMERLCVYLHRGQTVEPGSLCSGSSEGGTQTCLDPLTWSYRASPDQGDQLNGFSQDREGPWDAETRTGLPAHSCAPYKPASAVGVREPDVQNVLKPGMGWGGGHTVFPFSFPLSQQEHSPSSCGPHQSPLFILALALPRMQACLPSQVASS